MGTPEYLAMMRLRKIWAEGSFSVLKREHCISRIRKRGILAATEECLLAAMALNLKRMVNTIFRYPQIYCSAGTTVGFSSFFAFVNRSRSLQCHKICLPWDPTFNAYLSKKRAEGKHYNVALSHAAKKLVRLIYAMGKSQQSYRSAA